MKISKHLKKIVRELMSVSFKDGRIMESQVVKSIKALKSLPRYEAIPALSEYLIGLRRKEREFTMRIETLSPLSPTQIDKMKKIAGKKITKVSIYINPLLLGGFKFQVGDEVWDESMIGKVIQIKEAIRG